MEKYEKYKNSGIEWIGEVPKHWEVTRMASFGKFSKGKGVSKSQLTADGVPVILYGDIYTKYDFVTNDLERKTSKQTSESSIQIFNNDLLFTASGETREDIGKCVLFNQEIEAYAGGDVIIFRQNENTSLFLTYVFNSSFFREQKAKLSRGEIVVHIYQAQLRDIYFALPPKQEQTKIATYLDQKTTEIDQLITQKETLLKHYAEEKTVIINQAVTKGINPKVKLKDSGVDWLGEIPVHWEITRMASFGKFSKGKGVSKSQLTTDGVPVILYGDIYTKYNFVTNDLIRRTSKETSENSIQIFNNDLLFTASGETREDIGKCVLFNREYEAFAGGDVIIFRQNKNKSSFLTYVFNSAFFREQKAKLSRGEIVVHIYQAQLRDIYFALPSKQEQTQIINHIETETYKINTKVINTKKLIALLKEYKIALISEVVTGKIKAS